MSGPRGDYFPRYLLGREMFERGFTVQGFLSFDREMFGEVVIMDASFLVFIDLPSLSSIQSHSVFPYVQDTASVSVSDEIDALQLMRNDMIPTEVDVSTSRRDDVSLLWLPEVNKEQIALFAILVMPIRVDKLKKGPLDQHLAKSNGIKLKVNILDGKLKSVGAWAA
ncbi:hypothetical protein Syun_014990 [Stephania yunnanensis]|uniref:Uncharacterized protein n=1 Tax=Stephania yunnanensis TaxID=152371 RepID=A0AAP0JMJ4_9MAGN